MRKALLMLLLAGVCGSAAAEWVTVGGDKAGGATCYVDPAVMRAPDDRAKMWSMLDYTTMQVSAGDRFMSQKALSEFDCKRERVRLLYLSDYAENMGHGKVVYHTGDMDVPGQWIPILPGSVLETMWQYACGKRGAL